MQNDHMRTPQRVSVMTIYAATIGCILLTPSVSAAAVKTIVLTSGTTWTVPADWNSTNNKIEVIGGGGGAYSGGGGGGGYARKNNAALTPGSTVSYVIGAAGTSGTSPTAGGDTFFCSATSGCASKAGASVIAAAEGGAAGGGWVEAATVPDIGGLGGHGYAGDVLYDGGRGGNAYGPSSQIIFTAGGGGGAGGPGGNGGAGGWGNESIGGGGGGASGSAVAAQPSLADAQGPTGALGVSDDVSLPSLFTTDQQGTRLYVVGDSAVVHEYTMSGWDISRATHTGSFDATAAGFTTLTGIDLSTDGTKMYLLSPDSGSVREYSLSTPWDVTSATLIGSFSFAIDARGLSFSEDGTRMYTTNIGAVTVNSYTLSTPWDVTTAAPEQDISIGGSYTDTYQVSVYYGGARMLVSSYNVNSGYTLVEFTLATPGNLSTATVSATSSLLDAAGTTGFGVGDDGYLLFFARTSTGPIGQYVMGGKSGGAGFSDQVSHIRGGSGGGLHGGTAAAIDLTQGVYTPAGSATAGGGGGGGSYAYAETADPVGGAGAQYSDWTDTSGGANNGQTFGSGGGGGAGGIAVGSQTLTLSDADGGAAGGYGGGGGGVTYTEQYAPSAGLTYTGSGAPGAATPGIIAITYETAPPAPARTTRLLGNVRLLGNIRIW